MTLLIISIIFGLLIFIALSIWFNHIVLPKDSPIPSILLVFPCASLLGYFLELIGFDCKC